MSSSEFAQSQLYKHGWRSGKGLGRTESGIKDAIKVKRKNNSHGLGHDQGSDFTFHWWDHIFNKAANSIKVSSNFEGDSVVEKDKNPKKVMPKFVSTKKPLRDSYEGKKLLYGVFVKAGTLKEEEDKGMESNSDDSDMSDEPEDLSSTNTLDKTFKLTGMTGHKAARHGHRLNGKLKRIQEQEEASNKMSKTETDVEAVVDNGNSAEHVKNKKKKKKRHVEHFPVDDDSVVESKRKKKKHCHVNLNDDEKNNTDCVVKKKKKSKKCVENTTEIDNSENENYINTLSPNLNEENLPRKKKKKKVTN